MDATSLRPQGIDEVDLDWPSTTGCRDENFGRGNHGKQMNIGRFYDHRQTLGQLPATVQLNLNLCVCGFALVESIEPTYSSDNKQEKMRNQTTQTGTESRITTIHRPSR